MFISLGKITGDVTSLKYGYFYTVASWRSTVELQPKTALVIIIFLHFGQVWTASLKQQKTALPLYPNHVANPDFKCTSDVTLTKVFNAIFRYLELTVFWQW